MHGGELYVPRIPSMRLVDLATVIAPNSTLKEVGVRPGEKLHEVMVPEDDARSSLELDDRYVILPADSEARRGCYLDMGARPLPDGFSYTSDRNPERMDARALQGMLTGAFTAAA
jgi:UDP-N-acetylglucosamine 4,6-dehydratase/5-epimerase